MTVGELIDRLKGLPADKLVCVAEIDEAFGINIDGIDVADKATIESRKPDGTEAIDLENGADTVVVIRW